MVWDGSKELTAEAINGCIAALALQSYEYGVQIDSLRKQLAEADKRCREYVTLLERLQKERG